jgi:cytoskeletal protein CcmA (bactofilin family)
MKFSSNDVKKFAYNESIANRISPGAVIEGELSSETNIRIDGKIKGILRCAARLVIGKTGAVEGDVQCKEATIEGVVTGKLEVNGLLFLKRTAVIEGEIFYKRLIVEEGAIITGILVMSGGTTKQLVQPATNAKKDTFGISQTA